MYNWSSVLSLRLKWLKTYVIAGKREHVLAKTHSQRQPKKYSLPTPMQTSSNNVFVLFKIKSKPININSQRIQVSGTEKFTFHNIQHLPPSRVKRRSKIPVNPDVVFLGEAQNESHIASIEPSEHLWPHKTARGKDL